MSAAGQSNDPPLLRPLAALGEDRPRLHVPGQRAVDAVRDDGGDDVLDTDDLGDDQMSIDQDAQGAMDAKSFAAELRKWWSFDDRQMHTHSWHSREDFIERKLPELLAMVISQHQQDQSK